MSKDDPLNDVGRPRHGKRPLSVLDRSIQAAVADQRELGDAEDPAAQTYPQLWEWLTRTKASRDLLITGGKMTVTAGPGGFVVQLTHADMAQTVETACTRLDSVLAAMEAYLQSPGCVVKSWGKKQPTARKRKPIS